MGNQKKSKQTTPTTPSTSGTPDSLSPKNQENCPEQGNR